MTKIVGAQFHQSVSFIRAQTREKRVQQQTGGCCCHVSEPCKTRAARSTTRATRHISCCTAAHCLIFAASSCLLLADRARVMEFLMPGKDEVPYALLLTGPYT